MNDNMMSNDQWVQSITKLIMDELQAIGLASSGELQTVVPVGVSARHVHLSAEHLEVLFGKGSVLTKYKDISQPGQYAANETVTLVGPQDAIQRVRVLGPCRGNTQVELAPSDARKLGIKPPVRESGDLENTPGIRIIGPAGSLQLDRGCIIAERHIHMTPRDASAFGVQHGQHVSVRVEGIRGGVMDGVAIKVRDNYALDMHIDTDDGNAFGLKTGDRLHIIK
ncbi:phosphate propanoyltransferase [Paenibacillus marinisediminis]